MTDMMDAGQRFLAQAQDMSRSAHVILDHDSPLKRIFTTLASSADQAFEFIPQTDVETALDEAGEAPVIIPVQPPVPALAQALAEIQEPQQALSAWISETDALLKVCRRARRQVIILDAHALGQIDSDSLGALEERLHLTFAAPPPGIAPNPSTPLHTILAAALLDTTPAASALADMLETMISGPVPPRRPDLHTIAQARKDMDDRSREAASTRTIAINLEHQSDLLRTSLEQVTQELEHQHQQHEEQTAALRRDHDAELQDTETRLKEAEARLAEERDLLRTSLEQVTQELEHQHQQHEEQTTALRRDHDAELQDTEMRLAEAEARFSQDRDLLRKSLEQTAQERDHQVEIRQQHEADLTALRQELNAAQQEAQQLRQRVEDIHASTSWKVTAPMRAIRRGLSGRG